MTNRRIADINYKHVGLPALAGLLVWMFLSLGLVSCHNEAVRNKEKIDGKELDRSLIEANKKAVETEDQQIEDLLSRYNWDMETTGTGLRYIIDDKGEGPKVKDGDKVTINYETRLITGDVVYSSEEDGPLTFVVGKSDVIAGVQEGVRMLGKGGKARLVIPSHLGYGLIGDQDKIRQKATLIYEIEVIDYTN